LVALDGSTSITARAQEVKPTPFAELEPLEKAVADKSRDLKLWEGRINAADQALSMLQETLSADVKAEELFSYIDKAVDRASEKRLQYELALVDLRVGREKALEELKTAEEELEAARIRLEAENPPETQTVRVKGVTSSRAPVIFEAHTGNARWSVRYDISLDSVTGLVTAAMYASVWQGSALDVEGDFMFHTRGPSGMVEPPELAPLSVNLAKAYQESLTAPSAEWMRKGAAMMESDAATAAVAYAPPSVPMVSSTAANVSVKGTGLIKRGEKADVPLGQFRFASTPRLVAIPERNREAWIVASLDSIPEVLLPGTAELYVDGAVSGRTNIPEFGLQGVLPMGMAQRVTAEKKRAVGKSGTSWLGLGKGGIWEDGYTIEVSNNMDAEREVEVRDRLPLPADDKISLEAVKIDPAPAARDKENRLTWKLMLKPGETKKISVEYTLRYPGDETLMYR
jgi:uncharacterized protein (TIGR02231 family)